MKILMKLTTALALTIMATGCVVALGNTSECDRECCKQEVKKECCSEEK